MENSRCISSSHVIVIESNKMERITIQTTFDNLGSPCTCTGKSGRAMPLYWHLPGPAESMAFIAQLHSHHESASANASGQPEDPHHNHLSSPQIAEWHSVVPETSEALQHHTRYSFERRRILGLICYKAEASPEHTKHSLNSSWKLCIVPIKWLLRILGPFHAISIGCVAHGRCWRITN